MSEKKGIFDDFTRKYSLSRTLRFSLIPVLTREQEDEVVHEKGYENRDQIRRQDKTEKFFTDNRQDIFEVDIERKKRYKALKYYLTELHKLFIKDALSKVKDDNKINFSTLFNDYKSFEVCKADTQKKELAKKINGEKVNLAKFFGDKEGKGGVFQTVAGEYYDWLEGKLDGEKKEKILDNKDKKQRKNNVLLSQNVLLILDKKIKGNFVKEKIEEDKTGENRYALNFEDFEKKEPTTLVKYFSGWSTYFENFNEIRGNLYKDEGRKEESGENENEAKIKKANAGQLTTRILDENLEIFARNAVWSEKNKGNLQTENLQNKDIVKVRISDRDQEISIFSSEFYTHCLLQTDKIGRASCRERV